MASLWKYEILVLSAADSKEREDKLWEMGRSGWELVSTVPGDWKTGATTDLTKLTTFWKREATHDIGY